MPVSKATVKNLQTFWRKVLPVTIQLNGKYRDGYLIVTVGNERFLCATILEAHAYLQGYTNAVPDNSSIFKNWKKGKNS